MSNSKQLDLVLKSTLTPNFTVRLKSDHNASLYCALDHITHTIKTEFYTCFGFIAEQCIIQHNYTPSVLIFDELDKILCNTIFKIKIKSPYTQAIDITMNNRIHFIKDCDNDLFIDYMGVFDNEIIRGGIRSEDKLPSIVTMETHELKHICGLFLTKAYEVSQERIHRTFSIAIHEIDFVTKEWTIHKREI